MAPRKYETDEQRRQAHNLKSKNWYHSLNPERKKAVIKKIRRRMVIRLAKQKQFALKKRSAIREQDLTEARREAFRILVKFWLGKI